MQQNGAGSGGMEVTATAGGVVFLLLYVAISLGLFVLMFASMWRVFTKAGQPGWGFIVPIYDLYLLCKIAGKPWWWMFLMVIPCVGFIFGVMVTHAISRNFGKDVGFTVGLILLPVVFVPILAWGSAQYQAPAVATM